MDPRPCNAIRCPHCGAAPPGFKATLRPLTPDDLRWYLGESAAAIGIRSTHGAFVDMAMSGIQPGGRSNGVEARAVEERRLAAVARERCITARLAHVAGAERDVLRALYGLDHWATAPELSQVRAMLQAALGELADVAPMTPTAREHAARRQAHRAPPRAPKERPSQRRTPVSPAEAARKLLADDYALAGSPRGAVIAAVAREDKTELLKILAEARGMAAAARLSAGVVELQPSRRTRNVQFGARPAPPAEEYLEHQHAEVLAGG